MGLPGDYSDAACKSVVNREIFHPVRGTAQISARDAKAVCQTCPKMAQCLEDALANKERFGIWGGMSERERAAVLKGRRVAAKRRELEVAAAKDRRSRAARAAWERRKASVTSRPSLKQMLAQGLITRGEFDQEMDHRAAVATRTRSKESLEATTRTSGPGRRKAA